MIPDLNSVTFAGSSFQAGAGQDADMPAGVTDDFFALKVAGSDGDSAPLHAEQIGENLVRELESIRCGAVVRHEQPSRQPHLDFVERIAGRSLKKLPHQDIGIALERVQQARALAQHAPHVRG